MQLQDVTARRQAEESLKYQVFHDMLTGLGIRLVKRILASGEDPFALGGQEVFVTMSVGTMLANGDEDAGSVLRNADTAMYQAKNDGRGQAIMFREDMHQTASSRLNFESQLRRALDKNELRVYYQPIVDMLTEDVVGFEALVRWIHPKHGLILPLEFIPVAEETGMIIPIGEWVLRQALAQVQQWRTEAPGEAAGLWVAVNVSISQLQEADFVGMVTDALTQTGFDPPALHLEITETGVMNDIGAKLKTLHALRLLGVQLSIDDFGTGQASLSYLSRLPVQTLKIDRSFVEGLGGEDLRTHHRLSVRSSISAAR